MSFKNKTNLILIILLLAGLSAGLIYCRADLNNPIDPKSTAYVGDPAEITTQPIAQAVTSGQSVTFSVVATGVAPITYEWFKDGSSISRATSATYTITSAAASDSGSYTVVVTNSQGNVTSNAAYLTVSVPLSIPLISVQPVSQTIVPGQGVTFSIIASGYPIPSYQWKKNGADITNATSSIYTISSVATSDSGSYTVVATNSQGSITSNAALLTVSAVFSAPVISVQPVSQTVTVGQSVTLNVTASGNPTPSCQWNKNGTNISGATSTMFTIGSADVADSGSYAVVVTNNQGAVTSNAAILTVFGQKRPVAYYPFNGNANDESGNGNNGTVNGATLTTDRFGNANRAYSFNGTSNYISAGSNSLLENTHQHTVCVWAYSTKTGDGGISGYIGTNGQYGYYIQQTSSTGKTVAYEYFSPPVYKAAFSNQIFANDSKWHFYVLNRSNDTTYLYVDGIKQDSLITLSPSFSGGAIYIGYARTQSQYFGGKIDDVGFYNYPLSQAKIDSIYHVGGWTGN
jgi:hypothetical protein